MPSLLPVLFYPDLFRSGFHIELCGGKLPVRRIGFSLPGRRSGNDPSGPGECLCPPPTLFGRDKDRMELSIRVYKGTLKYYYPNYKDYYYLIYEDTAIHKSVGEFVDKDARIKGNEGDLLYEKKTASFSLSPRISGNRNLKLPAKR